ncbi:LEA type 2 family protein [Tolumonas lignilytica]|uniref:LEA type 2 family protein n=1 Tax=Tolumonas lignilytica TaxID=1283284 RepID=UPI00046648BC|nr:LEA type 2 family protein [Tolumonas lignilytica]
MLKWYRCVLTAIALTLTGCAALQPKLEAPSVAVNSVKVMPGQGLNLRFLIGLHVQNPNAIPLPIHGINYTVALSGQPVVSGNSQNQPTIPAHGEQDVEIEAVADLVNGLSLANTLLSNPLQQEVPYAVKAAVDVGAFLPNIPVQKSGTVNLTTGTIR